MLILPLDRELRKYQHEKSFVVWFVTSITATGGLFTRISWDNNDWWDRGKPLGNGGNSRPRPGEVAAPV